VPGVVACLCPGPVAVVAGAAAGHRRGAAVAVSGLPRPGDDSPREIASAARMAVTARASSNGRSPGPAMIASTPAPRPARRTIPSSSSARSPRSASAAWAASIRPWRAARRTRRRRGAPPPIGDRQRGGRAAAPACRRHLAERVGEPRSGQCARQHLPDGELADQHVAGHPCQVALHPVHLVPARLRLLEPVPDGAGPRPRPGTDRAFGKLARRSPSIARHRR
jgi:hypothetical protein